MFPYRRNRRLRATENIRKMVRETVLTPGDFLVPLFIIEGKNKKEAIPSMPDYYRLSLDLAVKEVRELQKMGICAILLFVKVPDNLKDNKGTEALNPHGLMPRAIKAIKDACPEMIVMTDVAMDPYSAFGHDGIVADGRVLNDETCSLLAEMSVIHARNGADFVAPSDMMDGRIQVIREALEDDELIHTGIMSYSAKFASGFYGPFRDALDSAPVDEKDVPKDKRTYQMDTANRREAVKQALMDMDEGADIVMVKPGGSYLDIVREVRDQVEIPVAVYQVSGEYAMIKAAAEKGWLDHDTVMMEQLLSMKRAGADIIATYFAKTAVSLL